MLTVANDSVLQCHWLPFPFPRPPHRRGRAYYAAMETRDDSTRDAIRIGCFYKPASNAKTAHDYVMRKHHICECIRIRPTLPLPPSVPLCAHATRCKNNAFAVLRVTQKSAAQTLSLVPYKIAAAAAIRAIRVIPTRTGHVQWCTLALDHQAVFAPTDTVYGEHWRAILANNSSAILLLFDSSTDLCVICLALPFANVVHVVAVKEITFWTLQAILRAFCRNSACSTFGEPSRPMRGKKSHKSSGAECSFHYQSCIARARARELFIFNCFASFRRLYII